jgi:hypothetical protein
MTDIIERLRKGATHGVLIPCEDLTEAADEIDRLRRVVSFRQRAERLSDQAQLTMGDQSEITLSMMIEDNRRLQAEVEQLRGLIGRPYIGAWTDEIIVEASHQRDRWGADHDHGKQPEDWFWLIGYLAGKCLAAHKTGDSKKAHHHTVSTGAVLAHWAAAIDGNEGIFRPGLGAEKVVALTRPERS